MPITLEYQLTAGEFLRGCERLWRARKQGSVVNFSLGVAAIIGGLVVRPVFDLLGWCLLAVGGVLVLLVVIRRLLWWRAFKTARKFQHPMEVSFSEDGIGVVTADGRSMLEWTFYSEYLDADDVLILCADKRNFSVIPKRALKSDEASSLADLLARKLQKL